ncbi:biogenesis of lysosome-related organelles complex 1 subunit 1-like, partial [Camellia sinensis]|uniref:biogenesis of lysosome-related organelles complex 1 subunit 1-like n=1 Tax=Camellia sinensis TaxID=4442 RepID=UPI001036E916
IALSLSLSCLSFSVRSEKSLRSIHFLFIFTPFSLTCCLSTNLTAIFSIDQVVVQKVKESEITEQDSLLLIVNGGVQESFVNEKRIELEIRSLAATIMRFAKQTDQWLAASRSINTAIKEIGDFENWMKTMEFDCKSISAAICNIHQA